MSIFDTEDLNWGEMYKLEECYTNELYLHAPALMDEIRKVMKDEDIQPEQISDTFLYCYLSAAVERAANHLTEKKLLMKCCGDGYYYYTVISVNKNWAGTVKIRLKKEYHDILKQRYRCEGCI